MKHKCPFTLFLSFILFAFLSFTPPLYVECENLCPDEILDLVGIPENSGGPLTILKYHPSVCCFSNLFPKAHSARCHESGNLYSEPFTSELVLSITLRC